MDFQYAGFNKRLIAGLVDTLILIPLYFVYYVGSSFPKPVTIVLSVIGIAAYSVYNTYFHAKFGQTPGKMVAGIRVLKTDGHPITVRDALMRSSVDIALAVVLSASATIEILSTPDGAYQSEWSEAVRYAPAWGLWAEWIDLVWIWSEVVVVLFNRKRRAIHDFIAGTIVVVDPRPQLEDLHAERTESA